MGDYNCKHVFFGCKKANKEGDILFDILEELELLITNDDTPTHRPGTNIGDLLDLAIVSRQMAPRIESCEIGQDIGSDHLPVHLTLTSPEIQKQNQKEILQYEKTDWKRLNKHIEHNLEKSKAKTPLEIDRDSDVLINAINEGLNKSCPKAKIKDRAFYISEETIKLIKLKRQIRRQAQKTQDPELKNLYNQLDTLVKKAIQDDKRKEWEKTTKLLDETKDCRLYWRTINNINGNKSKGVSKPIIQEDGSLTKNDLEKANTFAKSLGKIHNTHEGDIFDKDFKIEVENKIDQNSNLFSPLSDNKNEPGDDNPIMREITVSEIKLQLNKTKGKSAPGADGIKYPILKKCPNIVFENLAHIYNQCLNIGYFPKKWKEATGTMIPKPKKDPKIVTNYRPISLLSCVGKLFEKILANRIRSKLEEENFFNLWQIGYRNKRCAMEHVLRLVDDAQIAQTKNQVGAAVFIDVEKAFDSVWHDGLKYKLMNSNLPRKIVRLMASFITNRKIAVNINGTISDQIPLNAGTPQGSVLSPLLFLIYVNDIPIDPLNINVSVSQFADDLGFLTIAKNGRIIQYRLAKTLSDLEIWCSKWRIKLNAKKTQLLLIRQTKQRNLNINLELFGEKLINTDNTKLLGVTLEENLSFKAHIDDIAKRGRMRLNLLKILSGTTWGCKPQTLMRLYKAYIRPVLEYGAIVMLSAKDQAIKKLQIIQNKAIKIAFRLHPRSRTNEIHKLAEIPLIKTRLEELSTNFICSLNENSELFKQQNIIRAARIKRGHKTLLDKLQNIHKEHHN